MIYRKNSKSLYVYISFDFLYGEIPGTSLEFIHLQLTRWSDLHLLLLPCCVGNSQHSTDFLSVTWLHAWDLLSGWHLFQFTLIFNRLLEITDGKICAFKSADASSTCKKDLKLVWISNFWHLLFIKRNTEPIIFRLNVKSAEQKHFILYAFQWITSVLCMVSSRKSIIWGD